MYIWDRNGVNMGKMLGARERVVVRNTCVASTNPRVEFVVPSLFRSYFVGVLSSSEQLMRASGRRI